MKKVLAGLLFMTLLLAACSPQAQPTDLPAAGVDSQTAEAPTQASGDLTAAQNAAVSELAKNLGLDPSQIKIVSTEAVEWPDSCLGVSVAGIMCSQVITPGYRVVLEANGKQVEYHTNQAGTSVVPATVALTWSRDGGIAGFCDSLTIYLSGEVQGTTCKGGNIVQKSVSELLSPAEIATMNEWISKYGEINIDASDPKGAADAMTVKLTMHGTGTEQSMNQAAQQQLLEFIQNLNRKLMGR